MNSTDNGPIMVAFIFAKNYYLGVVLHLAPNNTFKNQIYPYITFAFIKVIPHK